ncbi:beta-propeller domain-containing protein [Actinophytocola oryzae]|uniref:Beta propeller domain-containing protein n=1 Tax=Actinophytocola oryzae TaxID=502181 RepID=A0A4R7V213_9PSEU|nr:beta-propeller domain-containing protein [Actinophytocola oryzae]TDV42674.1 beta propeller domain-containing protein [Actinophytocola oryzae]
MRHHLPSTRRSALTAGVVMALGAGMITAGVVVGAADGGGETHVPQGIRLVAYDSCASALREMKDRLLPHVGAYGLESGDVAMPEGGDMRAMEDAAGAAPKQAGAPGAPEAGEHSTTNVHEAGVDEPDLVKTDGRRVVSVADGVIRVVDVASRAVTATVPLDGNAQASQLLLAGDRALVMTSSAIAYDVPGIAPGERTPKRAPTDTLPGGSQLVLVDLTGAGKVLATLAVDGTYLDARQVGDIARVVVRSMPHMEFRYPATEGDQFATLLANKDTVVNSTIGDWLPRYQLTVAGGATTNGQLTACADVSHPVDYTATGMLTVLSFDLTRELGTGDPVTIVADGDTVYGTERSLYVADDHFTHGTVEGPLEGERTELYQFDISGPGKPVHVASGGVDGSLLNQYSLSEYEGNLRVATTTSGRSGSQSMITVLTRKGDQLTRVGQVGGLGLGERIYAVRYFGDIGYVVTFRQTDPLYTVDLSDPAAPKVTGELKITGYSAYLHPAGDGRLIGVGQEASEAGRAQGAQLSLFDTSNPAGATRLAQYHLPSSYSEVESDPHAFLYWPDANLVVLPMSGGGDPNLPYGGAVVLRLRDNGFTQVAVLGHRSPKYGDTPLVPRRAMVVGDELWTVSEAGMLVNDTGSLAQLAWVPFV